MLFRQCIKIIPVGHMLRNASVALLPVENSEHRSLLENLPHPLEGALAREGRRLGEQKSKEKGQYHKICTDQP